MVLSILFIYIKPFTAEKGQGALVVPLPKFERAEYCHIPNENKCFCAMCFLGILGLDLENQYVSSDTSNHS